MRTAGHLNAGLQQSSQGIKGHAIFRVLENANLEADLPQYERGIDVVLPEEGRDYEERPYPDISLRTGRRILWSILIEDP